jgi:hypothetical protein
MKKISVLMVLLVGGLFTFGQSLSDINDLLGKNDYAKAKEGIDKFLSDPKNATKAEAWYMKGRIYNSYSKEPARSGAEAFKLKTESFEAFKKYQQMDAKDVQFILGEKNSHTSYVDLYYGFFDLGAANYNAKDYAGAATAFKAGIAVGDYFRLKNYDFNGVQFPALDTSLVLNTAISLKSAGNDAEAMTYYKKLADANLKTDQYESVYANLIAYYNSTNDAANLKAITDKATAFYPNENWSGQALDADMDKVDAIKDKKEQLAQLDIVSKKYPTNAYVANYYASKLFNAIYFGDASGTALVDMKTTMENNLKVGLANGNKDEKSDANTLMGRYLYNTAFEYNDSLIKYSKTAKPGDIKKKGEYKALFDQKVNEAIPYSEEVVKYFAEQATLKTSQKGSYKLMLQVLIDLYNAKGDKAKAAEYTKKKEEVEKM